MGLKKLFMILFVGPFFSVPAIAQEWPAPQPGYKRLLIPAQKDPYGPTPDSRDLIFEVNTGKVMETDTCNHYAIVAARLVEKTIEGWGASYYVYERTEPASPTDPDGDWITMSAKGCVDDPKTIRRWVSGPSLRFYEPSFGVLVIYVPNHLNIRYRKWVPKTAKFKVVSR